MRSGCVIKLNYERLCFHNVLCANLNKTLRKGKAMPCSKRHPIRQSLIIKSGAIQLGTVCHLWGLLWRVVEAFSTSSHYLESYSALGILAGIRCIIGINAVDLGLGSCDTQNNSHGNGPFFYFHVGGSRGIRYEANGTKKSMCINLGTYWMLA